MWVCENCGHENDENSIVCKNCGALKVNYQDDNQDSADLFFDEAYLVDVP